MITKENKQSRYKIKHKLNKRFGKFGVFLISYTSILIAVVLILLILLNGLLKDYEKSMPNNTMNIVVKEFSSENMKQLLVDNSVKMNEFESVDSIVQYFEETIQNNEVTYKRKNGEFTNNNPVYLVMAGETIISKVTLTEKGKNAHKFTEWKLGSISFDGFVEAEHEVTISAPSAAEVKINGIKLSEAYIVQRDVKFEPVKNVDAFVKAPTLVVYKVKGLTTQPKITASLNGIELDPKTENKICKIGYPTDTTLIESQRANIIAINEAYGKYIINRGGLSALTKNLVGNANTYVSNIPAVWAFLYGKTYTYEFKNQTITNMVKYSDDCFSCDINYDLFVDWSTGNKNYNTSMKYTFVKINGGWFLADFIIN